MESILGRYKEVQLFIDSEVLDLLIDKTASISAKAMPYAACDMLDMVAAAKVNSSQALDRRKVIFLSPDDIEDFFTNHSRLVDLQKPDATTFSLTENVKTRLSDVGGCTQAKEAIQEDLIAFLRDPDTFIKERGSAPKGFLLEGPAGNGKTLLARAVAGETSTPFIATSASEFVEKYVGLGAKRIRELFTKARDAAENSPNKTAVVFIDEFDAIGKKRTGHSNDGEAEQTLNQLLTEMDGFNNKESRTRIVVIAATNRKDILDEAAIRPGRFDDTFTIKNPGTIADRLEILNIHAKKLKFASEAEKVKILGETARMISGMSGAEIAAVLQKARKVVSKRETNKVITNDDIVEGYLQVLAGPINKVTDEMPLIEIENTVRHEAGHAFMIDLLKPLLGEKISFITLDPRGNFLGAVFHHSEAQMTPDFKSVIMTGAVNYAGGIAEPQYNSRGAGAGISGDVEQVTELFDNAIKKWGLGRFTPPITMTPDLAGLHQVETKKDLALMSETSRKIAKLGLDFGRDFLDLYMENYAKNRGKGGNSLSGESFSKMRQEWLTRTGRVEAERNLLDQVLALVDNAYHSNKSLPERFARKALQAVRRFI